MMFFTRDSLYIINCEEAELKVNMEMNGWEQAGGL